MSNFLPDDEALIKKPNTQEVLTEEHVAEIMKCSDPNTGYMYFAKHHYYIQHPTDGQQLFKPFDYQVRILEAYHNNKFVTCLAGRQLGKCLTNDTFLKIKNKVTGEEKEITIGEFFLDATTKNY